MPKYILFLTKLKGERRPFWSIDLSSKLSLTSWGNVDYYKSIHHPIPHSWEHPGNFQNKSVSSPFSWVSRYIFFLAKLKRRGRPSLEDARRGAKLWDYFQEHLFVITDEKVSPFVKFENPTNSYLELSKENVLGNMMLSHWPCFTWKFFMTWFHRILKLIFQKQPPCRRNKFAEHWKKLPKLTAFLEIFLYLKNNDAVEHV